MSDDSRCNDDDVERQGDLAERERMVKEISTLLWERFPESFARYQLALQSRKKLVSFDTLKQSSIRRVLNALQSKNVEDLTQLRGDLEGPLLFLKTTIQRAVWEKVRRLSRLPTQSLDQIDPAENPGNDRLDRLTLVMLSQRELLSAGDRAILEMRDDRHLNYDEIFLQERWPLVSDRLSPEALRLLTPVFVQPGVVGERAPEFVQAVEEALGLLKSLGHGLTDDAKKGLYRRYETSRQRLQQRLEKLVQEEFLD